MKPPYLFGVVLVALTQASPTVDEKYPYNGPSVPIGDWVDHTINGNGRGFERIHMPPAVHPAHPKNATNNVNVISLSYIPAQRGGDTVGINIHYQTPFNLGVAPSVHWGTRPSVLDNVANGLTVTYDRTPPCSLVKPITECSQFYHNVQIEHLQPGTTYYYQIPAANHTTQSPVLNFTTAQAPGNPSQFSIAINNDMGYTNANGTYTHMIQAMKDDGLAFVWHGGDLSYADDWYTGIIQCNASVWPVCFNGSYSSLPNNDTNPDYFNTSLPEHEIPNQGSPRGGDIGVLYESNWDLWQQWMNNITMKIPYIVLPGNHEATCADHDNTPYVLSSYLNENKENQTMSGNDPNATLTYYSCPPSQRNFTAFQNRFFMAGDKSNGVGNFWHSFDYGLAHFVSIDTETDYAHSPDKTFLEDIKKAKEEEECKENDKDSPKCKTKEEEGDTYTCQKICLCEDSDETDDAEEEKYLLSGKAHPLRNETHITDAGPFGYIDGSITDNKAYQQYQWLKEDLAKVDRCKTPWVIVMGHRPMYSSHSGNYHLHLREAFESLFLKHKVDLYIAGHVHWYERLKPIRNCHVDGPSVVKENIYRVNPGHSMVHLINGAAGNIESHSTINMSQAIPNITAHRNLTSFGFSKLTVFNATNLSWQFIQGHDGLVGDELTVLKDPSLTCKGYKSYSSSSSSYLSESSCSSECSGSGIFSWFYCNLYCSNFWEPLKR
ncbi:acid phosphatase [Fusarium longipes]|uniref:Purple acid phosphatase n=1 Tax=Fusarium longipes TaxID=694270 RepID=A0A395T3A2_9HYPO|nr:acid phosphatase [Fusarium longipes]